MGFANERLKTRTLFVTLPATPASTAKQQRRQNKFIGRARVIKFIKQDLNYNVSLLFFLLLLYSLCINWRGAARYLNILILVLILALVYSYRWDFSLVIYCAFVGQGWQRTCILLQRTKQAINMVCLSVCLSFCLPACRCNEWLQSVVTLRLIMPLSPPVSPHIVLAHSRPTAGGTLVASLKACSAVQTSLMCSICSWSIYIFGFIQSSNICITLYVIELDSKQTQQ